MICNGKGKSVQGFSCNNYFILVKYVVFGIKNGASVLKIGLNTSYLTQKYMEKRTNGECETEEDRDRDLETPKSPNSLAWRNHSAWRIVEIASVSPPPSPSPFNIVPVFLYVRPRSTTT
jgi:hypothetical protein